MFVTTPDVRLTEADVRALAQLLLEARHSPADPSENGPTTTVITIEHRKAGGYAQVEHAKPAIDSPYLTVAQAATYCKRSPKTLLNHHSLGTLRSVSTSRPLLFLREDLDAWLTTRPKRRRK
jgi:hypothetical protein